MKFVFRRVQEFVLYDQTQVRSSQRKRQVESDKILNLRHNFWVAWAVLLDFGHPLPGDRVDDVTNPKVKVRKKHNNVKNLGSLIVKQLLPALALNSFDVHSDLLVQNVVVQPVYGNSKNPTAKNLVVGMNSIVNPTTSHSEDDQECEQ